MTDAPHPDPSGPARAAVPPSFEYPGERAAVVMVVRFGAIYGYGNLIDRLRRAWADHLVSSGMDRETALRHVGLTED
jgi:hypothetical protein